MTNKKEVNHLLFIKKDFSHLLKEKFNLDVIGTNIKHKVDMCQSDVIKFTVCFNNEHKFIYVYINRQDKKTIHISTDINETFLDELSQLLLHKDADSFIKDFNKGFLDFTNKYSLLKSSDFHDEPFFKSQFGFIRSYSSHSYFYAMRSYSNHFLNAKLYKVQNSMIMMTTKLMFQYRDGQFIAYPYLKIKFGSVEHDIHLSSAHTMQNNLAGFLTKVKNEIDPIVQTLFKKLFDIDEAGFKALNKESFEDHLAIIAMQHI
jgi:hypothetical protein